MCNLNCYLNWNLNCYLNWNLNCDLDCNLNVQFWFIYPYPCYQKACHAKLQTVAF
jgi:hypothetical protein